MRCVREQRASLDPAGEAVAGAVVAGVVHDAQRAAADGAARRQLSVPLVRGAEHRRSGVGRDHLQQEPGAAAERRDRAGVAVVEQARGQGLLSDEHFTVDGTLIEAWAGHKSFKRKDGVQAPHDDDPGNPSVDFHGQRLRNATHQSSTDPEARLARKAAGKEASSATPGTCGWTIARAWRWERVSTKRPGAPNPRRPLSWWKRSQ